MHSIVKGREVAGPPVSATGKGPEIAVVGGGIAGLAGAYFLTRAGARVTLLESSDQFGGLGTFFTHAGQHLDRFYHVMLPTDDDLLALLGDLGLGGRVYWKHTSMGFFYDRRLYPLNTPLDLLRFKPAAFVDRVRLGLSALYASYLARPGPLDDITVEEWLSRLSGRRAFDRVWRPLLEAKFGDAYRRIPALWYWARFNREKGTKKEVKGYVRGGYKGIADALVQWLEAHGAALRLGAPVDRLDAGLDGRPTLRVGGATHPFDQVLLTTPLVLVRGMMQGGAYSSHLNAIHSDIDYQGVVNVIVMLRRSLTPHYWIAALNCDVPFQGIVETTRMIDLEDTGGRHLVYLLNYAYRTGPLFQRDLEDLKREYLAALAGLFPDLRPSDVIDVAAFRAPFVEPLYTPGYTKRKPPAELVPGRVYLATTTQVYPNVTSWNSSTGLARRVVTRLLHGSGIRR